MYKINKLDYFVGVFLTAIINSSKGVPALFDETNNSKRVEFITDTGEYNVYIKYTTAMKTTKTRGRKKVSANISFSKRDYKILKDHFYKENQENFICIVFTNEQLNESYMAMILYEDAMKCLENSTDSGYRKITVTRIGAEHDFNCYGVDGDKREYIKCPVDCTKFLSLEKSY